MTDAELAVWSRALAMTAREGMVCLTEAGWDVWDACYGEEGDSEIPGMDDALLAVAFLAAIDLAGDTP